MMNVQPVDLLALWVLVGLYAAVYIRGRRSPRTSVRVGARLEERRAAVDPKVVQRIFAEPRELPIDEQLRRAAGGRRP